MPIFSPAWLYLYLREWWPCGINIEVLEFERGFPKSSTDFLSPQVVSQNQPVSLCHNSAHHSNFASVQCRAAKVMVGKRAECKACRSTQNYRLVWPPPLSSQSLGLFLCKACFSTPYTKHRPFCLAHVNLQNQMEHLHKSD